MRVGFVADQFEIFEFEIKDIFNMRVQVHFWQGFWLARELELRLFNVIGIEVRIAKGMNKFAGF